MERCKASYPLLTKPSRGAQQPQDQATEFKMRSDTKLVKINVDKHRDIALEYGVRSVPCFIFFDDGAEKNRKFGAMPVERLIQMTGG